MRRVHRLVWGHCLWFSVSTLHVQACVMQFLLVPVIPGRGIKMVSNHKLKWIGAVWALICCRLGCDRLMVDWFGVGQTLFSFVDWCRCSGDAAQFST
jgi:hypothetical protein